MIILIAGGTHTGKTVLAQKLLEHLNYPYLSIDHLKMGLIRSGLTELTPESDENKLTAYIWPIVREIIKTNIENGQNLIAEGCYIPFDFAKDFSSEYLSAIRYVCLVFSRTYLAERLDEVLEHKNAIEKRCYESGLTIEAMIKTNEHNLNMCKIFGLEYILFEDEKYDAERCAELVANQVLSRS